MNDQTNSVGAPKEIKRRVKRKPERNAQIVAALKLDKTLREIAAEFGISAPAVLEIGRRDCPEVMAARSRKTPAEGGA